MLEIQDDIATDNRGLQYRARGWIGIYFDLNRQDLIAMGYHPGPQFKEILTAVEDAQLEGDIATTEDAKSLVQSRWPIDELNTDSTD